MIRLSPGLAMNHRFQFNPKNSTLLLTQIDPRRRSLSRIKPRSGGDGVVFDSAAYESERLRLDAAAMEDMAETAKNELESNIETDPKAWKWIIRKKIWDLMESRKYSMSPRPVHHRIPNFVGASIAAKKVRDFMC